MWPESTLDQVAAHEAGHAIARVILGIPFSHVEVFGTDNARVVSGSDAKADWLPTLPEDYTVTDVLKVGFDSSRREDLFEFSVSASAGPIAQMWYEGHELADNLDRFSWFGGPGDASLVKQYCLVLASIEEDTIEGIVARKEELIEEILGAAHELVDQNQDWIQAVAAELEERTVVSRAQVEELRPDSP